VSALLQLNLVGDRWLPVRRASGRIETIRPAEITSRIDTDPVVAIASPRPDFDRALIEFLIGLPAVARPPIDAADWSDTYRAPPSPDDLSAAFAPHTGAFSLDGDGPRFMQDHEDFDGDEVPIAQLLIDMPGSNTLRNNADHFVKRGQVAVLSRPAAAMLLFTLQTYAPSGGAGHRTSLRGGGPLTTLVAPGIGGGKPATLWQIVWANVPDRDAPAAPSPTIFPWLGPTRVSDGKDKVTTPQIVDPLQAFWGMPRRIRLNFTANPDRLACDLTGIVDEVIVATYRTRPWGTNYEGWVHPLSPYYRQKSADPQLFPVHGQPGGIGWRDYLGLVASNALGDEATRLPAACVRLFRERRGRRVAGGGAYRLIAFGYDMDNMKARGWTEAEMPLWIAPNEALQDALDRFARTLVAAADIVRGALKRTIRSALLGGDDDRGDWSRIDERFWSETEADFYRAIAAPSSSGSSSGGELTPIRHAEFFERLKAAAFRIFDEEVSTDTLAEADLRSVTDASGVVRIINPVVEARRSLRAVLSGYRKEGQTLFGILGLDPPEAVTAGRKRKGKRT
jgi:CRISPR system Cascade subunit CasA